MRSPKSEIQSGLFIISILLTIPLILVAVPFAFYFLVIDKNDTGQEVSIAQSANLSHEAAVIATINAIPARDLNSGQGAQVADASGYSDSMIKAGESTYLGLCAACHGTDGKGVTGIGKTLIDSEFVRGLTDAELLAFVIQGRAIWDDGNTTGVAMPARGGNPNLSDQDILNIIAYIRVKDGHPGASGGESVVAEPSGNSEAATPAPTTDPNAPSPGSQFQPIDIGGIGSGGSEEGDEDAASGDNAADNKGAELYDAFCSADEASQKACDFLVQLAKDGADNARLTDLLSNGSSPFDSSIPSDVFIPQRGGSLFFSDADIQAFIVEVYAQAGVGGQETPAAETDSPADETSGATEGGNQALYEAFCSADEASQKACDFLVQLAKDGADNARLTDLLTNGSSPFDSSIPSDVFIPQRGGSLFFSDADIQAFIVEVYAQAGVGGQETPAAETDSPADETSGATEGGNQALYEAFCTVDEASQKACDFLVQLAKDGADNARLTDLLTNGSSPFDSSIPSDVFIPQRGGSLFFSDADIQALVDYLQSLAATALEPSAPVPAVAETQVSGEDNTVLTELSYTSELKGSLINPPRELNDFSLPSTKGDTFTLSEHGGKVLMVYFGYLTCPDVCPATLADLRRAYNEIDASADDVQVVFITIDPERDQLDIMARYVQAFNIDFIGLRPQTEAELEALKADFGVVSERRETEDSQIGYLIDHSATVFMIGPDGRIVSQYPFGVDYSEFANDMQVMIEYMQPAVDESALVQVESTVINDESREYRIVIPYGSGDRINMGEDPGIIPLKIELTLGEKDILVLENNDYSDFLVGGIWVAPYETVRKQFYEPQTFVGLCTVTVGRDLVEIIVSEPVSVAN